MISVAFDLAGHTGVAVQWADGTRTVYEWNLVRGDFGKTKRNPIPMLRLWQRLNVLSDSFMIKSVIFEETFARGAAKYRLDSLQHCVVLWCVASKIRWRRATPTEWKKAMLGDGKAPRAVYLAKAKQKWPSVQFSTDDQAAAMWLLEYLNAK